MKKITLAVITILGTIFNTFGQFSEGFEGSTSAPAGWSVINGGDANTFLFIVGAAGAAHSGTQCAQIFYSATAHDDYLVTPQIVVTAGVNDRITYFVKNQDPAYVEAYEVKLSTTTAVPASAFSVVLTPIANAPNTWTQFTLDLTAYIGQSVYVGFHAVSADKFKLYFDDIVNDSAALGSDTFETKAIKYYPNPVKDFLDLSFDQEISSVEVFNLLGQKVNTTLITASNNVQVDMSNLMNGPYMVKVISNNKMKTIKVIKE
jgi:hypothetical protein